MTDRLQEIRERHERGLAQWRSWGVVFAYDSDDTAYMLAEIDRLTAELAQAADDLAAATQTIRERTEAVLAIHTRIVLDAGIGLCSECSGATGLALFPCPTARAVGVTDQRGEVGNG